jgi:diacylglycerol kinase family enzyme
MRALLVVNHKATTTSGRIRDVLVHALRSEVDLEVAYTERRGHAATLAHRAAKDGMDVVVALGGDGTVNEVANGVLTDGPGPSTPAIAVVPGGSTNVFARAVGMPNDWVEATGVLLEALHEGRSRVIGLGRVLGLSRVAGLNDAEDRYFTFCAGFGLDAEVIRRVEQARRQGNSSSPSLYFRKFAGHYLIPRDRRRPRITLERPGEAPDSDLASAIVQNTAPWTFLGSRAVEACPDASFDRGLDMLGIRSVHSLGFARTLMQLLLADPPHGKAVLGLHDVPEFTLRAEVPMALQLDGEYLGEHDKVNFVSVPSALRVIC